MLLTFLQQKQNERAKEGGRGGREKEIAHSAVLLHAGLRQATGPQWVSLKINQGGEKRIPPLYLSASLSLSFVFLLCSSPPTAGVCAHTRLFSTPYYN